MLALGPLSLIFVRSVLQYCETNNWFDEMDLGDRKNLNVLNTRQCPHQWRAWQSCTAKRWTPRWLVGCQNHQWRLEEACFIKRRQSSRMMLTDVTGHMIDTESQINDVHVMFQSWITSCVSIFKVTLFAQLAQFQMRLFLEACISVEVRCARAHYLFVSVQGCVVQSATSGVLISVGHPQPSLAWVSVYCGGVNQGPPVHARGQDDMRTAGCTPGG